MKNQKDLKSSTNQFSNFLNLNPMRNLFVLFAFLFSLSLFTSCEQDELFTGDTVATKQLETLSTTEANAPAIDEDFGFDGKEEFYEEELNLRKEAPGEELKMDFEALANQVSSRSEYVLFMPGTPSQNRLYCGDIKNATLIGRANYVNNGFYDHFGYSADLMGGDRIYSFYSQYDQKASFKLTNTNRNLSMILLEGNYYNSRAYMTKVIKASSSSSVYSESLNDLQLEAGKNYILIIDSKPYSGSDFRLTVNCERNVRHCDNFQSRNTSQGIVRQDPANWSKWSTNSLDIPVVSNSGGGKMLKVQRNNYSSSQPDGILRTGTLTSGRYKLAMGMWVYSGKTAYLNIQKDLRTEWGAEIFFNSNGTGRVKVQGQNYYFNFPHNSWMDIEFRLDCNTNQVRFYINNTLVVSPWRLSATNNSYYGSYQLEGFNFYAPNNNIQYFVDNVCFDSY